MWFADAYQLSAIYLSGHSWGGVDRSGLTHNRRRDSKYGPACCGLSPPFRFLVDPSFCDFTIHKVSLLACCGAQVMTARGSRFVAAMIIHQAVGRIECTVGWGQFNDDNLRLRIAKEWTRICISYCWTMRTNDPEKMKHLIGGDWDEQQFYNHFWVKVIQTSSSLQ